MSKTYLVRRVIQILMTPLPDITIKSPSLFHERKMLDQTYDYAAMVAQFEADERLANRIDDQLNSPQRQSTLTISHTSSARQPNRLMSETLEEVLEQSLNSSNNSNVTIRRAPCKSITPKKEVFFDFWNFGKAVLEHAKINATLNATGVDVRVDGDGKSSGKHQ